MAKHTLELDDLELTALITHLEGQSEMMVESRLNCSYPSETPDRDECYLILYMQKLLQSVGMQTKTLTMILT